MNYIGQHLPTEGKETGNKEVKEKEKNLRWEKVLKEKWWWVGVAGG